MSFERVGFAFTNPEEMQRHIRECLRRSVTLRAKRAVAFSAEVDLMKGSVFTVLHLRVTGGVEVVDDGRARVLALLLISEGSFRSTSDDTVHDAGRLVVLDLPRIQSVVFPEHAEATVFTAPAVVLRRTALRLLGKGWDPLSRPVEVFDRQSGVGRFVASLFGGIEACLRVWEAGFVSDQTLRHLEEAAFLGLLDLLSQAESGNASDRLFVGSSTIRRAIEAVHADPGGLSVGKLADELGVSARSLQLGFLKHLGETPHEFIKKARLAAVRRDFERAPGDSIQLVARRWGFTNPSRFKAEYCMFFGVDAWPGPRRRDEDARRGAGVSS